MEEFFKEIKSYGYINHISSFLLILFFIIVAKKINRIKIQQKHSLN